MTAADFAYSSTVKQNMKRALEEFEKEISSCHCAPCQGNGVPVLKGTISGQLVSLEGLVPDQNTLSNPHTLRGVSLGQGQGQGVYLQGSF